MFKKAGIIVGIVVIVLAVVIWRIGVANSKPDIVDSNRGNQSDVVGGLPEDLNGSESSIGGNNGGDTNVTPVQQTPVVQVPSTPAVTELVDSDLGEIKAVKNEIMVIAKKKIVVLDKVYGDRGKQLAYCLDLLNSTNDNFSLYVNGSVYKDLNVGDKLAIEYNLHSNDSGAEFPIILSANVVK